MAEIICFAVIYSIIFYLQIKNYKNRSNMNQKKERKKEKAKGQMGLLNIQYEARF